MRARDEVNFLNLLISRLGSPDTIIELVGLKKFGPKFNLIDDRIESIRIEFGRIEDRVG